MAALDTLDYVDSVKLLRPGRQRCRVARDAAQQRVDHRPVEFAHARPVVDGALRYRSSAGRLDDVFRDITAPLQAKS